MTTRKTCQIKGCNRTYSLVKWRKDMKRFYPDVSSKLEKSVQENLKKYDAKIAIFNKGLCALHYDRKKRGVDLDAPIRPANINKIITG